MMDPEKLKAALDAIEAGDAEACVSILKDLIAAAAGGGAAPGATEELATEQNTEEPPADPATPPEEATALSILLSSTGAKTAAEAGVRLRALVAGHESAEETRRTVDLAERRDLIGRLVKREAETPATAWKGDPEKREPCRRLASMAIEDLRTWVAGLEAVPGGSTHTPPVSEGGEPVVASTAPAVNVAEEVKKLSPDLLGKIKQRGMTPEEFVKQRSQATRRIHK